MTPRWWLATLALASSVWSATAHAAFYSEGGEDWSYRVPLNIPVGADVDSTIVVDVDFNALMATLGDARTVDSASPRIVKADGTLLAEQEYNDTVYQDQLDAIDNARGEIRFILEDPPGAQQIYLYWDEVEDGVSPTNPALTINGLFEQSAGTVPTGWTTSAVNANGNQDNLVQRTTAGATHTVPAGCQTTSQLVDNSPFNTSGVASGNAWHLLGYRDRCEDGGSRNELIQLTRTIRVPQGAAAGTLDLALQVQAWDGIENNNNYDWFRLYLAGTLIDHRNIGLGNGLVVERTRFGRNSFDTGLIDFGWQNATIDLSGYAGSTIDFRIEARFSRSDNSYRSWIKIDDVEWSVQVATPGTPEADSTAAAGFRVSHDATGIYCLAEPVGVRVLDATGATLTNYVGEITLDTQTGSGVFSLLTGSGTLTDLGSGRAAYQFVLADAGAAQFQLSYTSGSSPFDLDVYQSDDASLRDDDVEGLLAFGPNGFTLTASQLSNPVPNPINDPLGTQVAGTDFQLHLTAYGTTDTDPDCGVIESYTGNRDLKFWTSYADPISGTRTASVDGNASANSLATATSQTVAFSQGQAQVTVAYKDAGLISLGAADDGTFTHLINGATNDFVVRPARLIVSGVSDLDGNANPAATSMTDTGFLPSGTPFQVRVTAIDADDDATPNFGLESAAENVRVASSVLMLPVGGRNGSTGDITGGTSFVRTGPGTFTSVSIAFDEVGIIRLLPSILDGDYLGSGSVPGAESANVGRFFPAAFVMTASDVTPACNDFTYQGQPALGLSYTVEARNIGGTVTQNYDTALIVSGGVATLSRVAENADDGIDLSARLSPSIPVWSAGRAQENLTSTRFDRTISPDGPFDDLVVGVQLIDVLDGVELTGVDMRSTTAGDCIVANDCDARALDASTQVRYGRFVVMPGVAPETEALDVPLITQFYDGNGFRHHTTDQCTSYALGMASLSLYQDALDPGETGFLNPAIDTSVVQGRDDPADPLLLSAPGLNNAGSVQLLLDVPNWLEFDWSGTGNEDPSARQTFGRFRGHDLVVFWEEVTRQ